MEIYKQTSSQSCLAVCLLQNAKLEISREKELALLFEAIGTTHPYAVAVAIAFCKAYSRKLDFFVDNQFYANLLTKQFRNVNINFYAQKIDIGFLEKLQTPFIVYLSTHSLLGTWDFSPHFVTIENITSKFFVVLDSATGKRMRVGKAKLLQSINELRDRVHYCPLAITLDIIQ